MEQDFFHLWRILLILGACLSLGLGLTIWMPVLRKLKTWKELDLLSKIISIATPFLAIFALLFAFYPFSTSAWRSYSVDHATIKTAGTSENPDYWYVWTDKTGDSALLVSKKEMPEADVSKVVSFKCDILTDQDNKVYVCSTK